MHVHVDTVISVHMCTKRFNILWLIDVSRRKIITETKGFTILDLCKLFHWGTIPHKNNLSHYQCLLLWNWDNNLVIQTSVQFLNSKLKSTGKHFVYISSPSLVTFFSIYFNTHYSFYHINSYYVYCLIHAWYYLIYLDNCFLFLSGGGCGIGAKFPE